MLKIERILYPTDFSPCAEGALGSALFFAERFGAELHMLHVTALGSDDPHSAAYQFPEAAVLLDRLERLAASDMAELLEPYRGRPVQVREAVQRGPHPEPAILDYAQRHDVDLIVLGTHGRRGVRRAILGSVAEGVLRRADCPVLTLRELAEPRPVAAVRRILAPHDFSDHSQETLRYALHLAALYGARLELLHVLDERPLPAFYSDEVTLPSEHAPQLARLSTAALDGAMAAVGGAPGSYGVHVRRGRPATEILDFARREGIDLIVLATHGLGGLQHLLVGSTAAQVARAAECPVFTVKSFGRSLLDRRAAEPVGTEVAPLPG